jgi:hypothetical protein
LKIRFKNSIRAFHAQAFAAHLALLMAVIYCAEVSADSGALILKSLQDIQNQQLDCRTQNDCPLVIENFWREANDRPLWSKAIPFIGKKTPAEYCISISKNKNDFADAKNFSRYLDNNSPAENLASMQAESCAKGRTNDESLQLVSLNHIFSKRIQAGLTDNLAATILIDKVLGNTPVAKEIKCEDQPGANLQKKCAEQKACSQPSYTVDEMAQRAVAGFKSLKEKQTELSKFGEGKELGFVTALSNPRAIKLQEEIAELEKLYPILTSGEVKSTYAKISRCKDDSCIKNTMGAAIKTDLEKSKKLILNKNSQELSAANCLANTKPSVNCENFLDKISQTPKVNTTLDDKSRLSIIAKSQLDRAQCIVDMSTNRKSLGGEIATASADAAIQIALSLTPYSLVSLAKLGYRTASAAAMVATAAVDTGYATQSFRQARKSCGAKLDALPASEELTCSQNKNEKLILSHVNFESCALGIVTGAASVIPLVTFGRAATSGALKSTDEIARATQRSNAISEDQTAKILSRWPQNSNIKKQITDKLAKTPADQKGALLAVVANAGGDEKAVIKAMQRFENPAQGLQQIDDEISAININLNRAELDNYNKYLRGSPSGGNMTAEEIARAKQTMADIEQRQRLTTERAILDNKDKITITSIEPNASINERQAIARIEKKLSGTDDVQFGKFKCEKSKCSISDIEEYRRLQKAYGSCCDLPPDGKNISRTELQQLLKKQYASEGRLPDVANPAPTNGYSISGEIKEGQAVTFIKVTSAGASQKRPTSFVGEYAVVDVSGPAAYQPASFSQNMTGTSVDGELTFYKAQAISRPGEPPVKVEISAVADANYGRAATGGSTQYIFTNPSQSVRFENVIDIVQAPRAEGPLGKTFLQAVGDVRSNNPARLTEAQKKLATANQDIRSRWGNLKVSSIKQLEENHRALAIDTDDSATVGRLIENRRSNVKPCFGSVTDAFQCQRLRRMQSVQAAPQAATSRRVLNQVQRDRAKMQKRMREIESQFQYVEFDRTIRQNLYIEYTRLRRNVNNLSEDLEDLRRIE